MRKLEAALERADQLAAVVRRRIPINPHRDDRIDLGSDSLRAMNAAVDAYRAAREFSLSSPTEEEGAG